MSLSTSLLVMLFATILLILDVGLAVKIYYWFLVPVGAPVLALPQLLGLGIAVKALTGRAGAWADKDALEKVKDDAPKGVPGPVYLLVLGYWRLLVLATYAFVLSFLV